MNAAGSDQAFKGIMHTGYSILRLAAQQLKAWTIGKPLVHRTKLLELISFHQHSPTDDQNRVRSWFSFIKIVRMVFAEVMKVSSLCTRPPPARRYAICIMELDDRHCMALLHGGFLGSESTKLAFWFLYCRGSCWSFAANWFGANLRATKLFWCKDRGLASNPGASVDVVCLISTMSYVHQFHPVSIFFWVTISPRLIPVLLWVQGALSSLSSTSGSCEPWSRRLLQFSLAQDNPSIIHHITYETQWQMDEDLDSLYSIRSLSWILFKMDSEYLLALVSTLSRSICLIL